MIPPIIHHIWMGPKSMPEKCHMCIQRAKQIYPSFTFHLWNDESVEQLLQTHFPEYLAAFQGLPRLIMKIDMIRYFIMYKFGGMYLDTDYFVLNSFDFSTHEVVLPANREENGIPTCVGNCIFASRPNHSFWKQLMDTLFTIDRQQLPTLDSAVDSDPLGTGPVFVFDQWNRNKDPSIYVPPRAMFHPPTKTDPEYIKQLMSKNVYGIHFCTGLWRGGLL
jgi:mannosyltransferase OCH1-like enzyme